MKIQKFIDANPLIAMFILSQSINRKFNEILAPHDLTLMQALILVSLFFEEEKRGTPKQLVKTFATTKSNMSHLISKLQEKKLLSRRTDTKDQRVQYITLTKDAEKIGIQLVGLFDKHQRQIEKTSSERQLLELSRFATKLATSNFAHLGSEF